MDISIQPGPRGALRAAAAIALLAAGPAVKGAYLDKVVIKTYPADLEPGWVVTHLTRSDKGSWATLPGKSDGVPWMWTLTDLNGAPTFAKVRILSAVSPIPEGWVITKVEAQNMCVSYLSSVYEITKVAGAPRRSKVKGLAAPGAAVPKGWIISAKGKDTWGQWTELTLENLADDAVEEKSGADAGSASSASSVSSASGSTSSGSASKAGTQLGS